MRSQSNRRECLRLDFTIMPLADLVSAQSRFGEVA